MGINVYKQSVEGEIYDLFNFFFIEVTNLITCTWVHVVFPLQSAKAALLDKNVIQNIRMPDKTIKKVPVDTEAKIIKLAAQLGSIDLSAAYGVPPGLAETMDIAAQVAVAAGMEALKSAGLVSGKSNDASEWKLPEKYRDSTGVVYASSFPAMDAVSNVYLEDQYQIINQTNMFLC
jgi:hypothetical protein